MFLEVKFMRYIYFFILLSMKGYIVKVYIKVYIESILLNVN